MSESGRGSGYRHRPNHGARGPGRPRDLPQGAVAANQRRPQQGSIDKYLTRDDIERLASSSYEDVVEFVSENEARFMSGFLHDRFCSNPLTLKRMIKILHTLTLGEEVDMAARTLGEILSSNGKYAQFCFHLNALLQNMPMEVRKFVRDENEAYLTYVANIGLFALDHFPHTAVSTFPTLQLKSTVELLIVLGHIRSGEHLKAMMDELLSKHQSAMKNVVASKLQSQTKVETTVEELPEPPDNFRELPVLPAPDEIRSELVRPFLRPNIIKGPYRDWEHYLDVQYRLLREDFVGPLRSGVSAQSSGVSSKDISKLRVYERVRVLGPVCLNTGTGFRIQFDISRLSRVRWEHSRRLIFGSLLCLSKGDNQLEAYIFATVMQRDPKLLCEGIVTVKFEGDVNGFAISPTDEFKMVESSAYFEAYRHILLQLQKLDPESMPFKKYIIQCDVQNVFAPMYLRTSRITQFDMKEVLGSSTPSLKFSITDSNAWPDVAETNLDSSQLKALKMALTQELSIIQGPPGTGKTFIGLKLVQALLQNRLIWNAHKTHPILVVCYTNHALDQFLEQIRVMEFNGNKPNIVRVGGRCKSETLKSCALFQKVQQCHDDKSFPSNIYRTWAESKRAKFQMHKEMESFVNEMDTSDGKILKLASLHNVIDYRHYSQLCSPSLESMVGKEIECWLGLWYFDTGFKDNTIDDEDDFIEVDEEAQLLENERIMDEVVIMSDVDQLRAEQNAISTESQAVTNVEWQTVQISKKERTNRIKKGLLLEAMDGRRVHHIQNILLLTEKEKWQLYKYWVNKYLALMKQKLLLKGKQYDEYCQSFNDAQKKIEEHVMQQADIIGMTTTGAAKYHHLLHSVRARILIVEEAAEVLESHVIVSLTHTIQQLILIGDHKQLKPNPNNYELGKKFKLDVSLFERLNLNGMPCSTLQVQRRMRPEISELLRPHIYDCLYDHSSVKKYSAVKGVQKNMFFIDHEFPEKSSGDSDSYSHSNTHEADFIVALCRYLLLQEYKPSQITILTMYRGQLLELKSRMRRATFEGVRVAAVDDFQGEENDIILLSLVRSNSNGDIGFLKVNNRVCVSLSRAKIGFYVIGNLSMVRSSDTSVWPQVLNKVEKQKCIGKALPLCCQVHAAEVVYAAKSEDFSKCPEGGCRRMCNTRLKCGHSCTLICHPYDREHQKFCCNKTCSKLLPCGHNCKAKCSDCTNGCQPCREKIEKVIPQCEHKVLVPCSDPQVIACTKECRKSLSCGHQCPKKCHEKCMDEEKCPEPCKFTLDCGHTCTGTCGSCLRGRLHIQCTHKCERTLACGHACSFPCTANCPPCEQNCKNYCNHSHCPKKCYELCSPCAERCSWSCTHFKCTKLCGELCNRPECNEPCTKLLPCSHPCIGLCGEKCPSLCRVCNKKDVKDLFFGTEDDDDARFIELQDCKHIFEVSGLDRWVKGTTADSSNFDQLIQFKKCPKCNVEIRRHLRYGNIIKQTLFDLENIKQKTIVVDINQLKQIHQATSEKLKLLCSNQSSHKIKASMDSLSLKLGVNSSSSLSPIFPIHIHAIKVQLSVIPHIANLYEKLNQISTTKVFAVGLSKQGLLQAVDTLHDYVMWPVLFDQQLHDIQCELRRLNCTTALFQILYKFHINSNYYKPSNDDLENLIKCMIEVYRSGQKGYSKLEERKETEIYEFASQVKKKYHIDELTEAEKIEVVNAMGLQKGHWFKCSNGHYYCIGECGGAMQRSRCPECGDAIGGENHALAGGNRHAPEMDGSAHPAWSDAANMQRGFD